MSGFFSGERPPSALVINGEVHIGREAGGVFATGRVGENQLFFGDGAPDDHEKFADEIKTFFKSNKIKNKKINLILKTGGCLLRAAKVPRVSERDMDGLVKNNAGDYFPGFAGNFTVSYAATGSADGKNEIFAAALPDEISEAHIAAFGLAGLKIIRIDVLQNAAAAAFRGEASALLALPFADKINVTYYENGLPKAARDIRLTSDGAPAEGLSMFARLYGFGPGVEIYFAEPDFARAGEYFPGEPCKCLSAARLLECYE